MSILLNAGPFEKKVPPAYDLKEQQDRKVLVWIECPQSSRADYDLPEKLAHGFQLYMTEKAGFKAENIIVHPPADLVSDPKQVARAKGVGYILLLQVDSYASDYLQMRDYYAGELITRSILLDVDQDTRVWPSQPQGKMVYISVEMEEGGRSALISRLISAAIHCTMRNLYPCDVLQYKHIDERVSTQEVFELETY